MRDRPLKLPRPTPYRALFIIALLALVALGLLVLDRTGSLDSARSRIEVVLNPALGGLSRLGEQVGSIGQGGDVERLRARVQELEQENSRLAAENLKAQALAIENEQLRTQVRLEQERPWKLLGADILAHSPDAARHLLTIAAGSEQGVAPGMAVIAQQGDSPPALIGVVEKVGQRSTRVLLITDFSSAVTARVYRSGRPLDGILQGQAQPGAELRLLQVDRSVPLAPGDTVVTAGLTADLAPELPNAGVPRDIPIGVVSGARIEGNTQLASVRPYVNPDEVRYAWILLDADG